MTTDEALLRAVLLHPGEDTPRLAYADWLDENGHPERAEFIRVQIELGRWHHDIPDGASDPLRDMRKREQELLGAAPPSWAAPVGWWHCDNLRMWKPTPHFTFRRGFVAHVACTPWRFAGGPCVACDGGSYAEQPCPDCDGIGTTTGVAASLFAAHPVTGVTLSDREPYRWVGCFYWGRETWGDAADAIPDELFLRLPDHGLSSNPESMRGFYTHSAALAALSAACVAFGREVAGLPPLAGS